MICILNTKWRNYCWTYICKTYVCPMLHLSNVRFVQCGHLSDVTFVLPIFVWRDICLPTTFVQYDFCTMWGLSNVTFVQKTFVQCVQNNYGGTDVCLTYVCLMWLVTNVTIQAIQAETSGDKRDKQWVLLNGNADIVITQLMPPNSSILTSPKLFIQT